MTRTWRRVAELWNGFWFAEGPTVALALFRILFAVCLWQEVATTRTKSVAAMAHRGFSYSYVDWIPHMSPEMFELLHDLQYWVIPFLALGLLARTSCAVLLFVQGWVFFADVQNFRNHPYFFLIVLGALALSPLADALSVPAAARALRRRDPAELLGTRRPLTFQRLIQVQVCIAYVYAAFHKMHPSYLRGEVLALKMGPDVLEGDSASVLEALFSEATLATIGEWVREPAFALPLAWATVGLELLIPLGLWHRRWRPVTIACGVVFHLSIAFVMNITVFSLAMIGTYLLFLDPERVRAVAARCLRIGASTSR